MAFSSRPHRYVSCIIKIFTMRDAARLHTVRPDFNATPDRRCHFAGAQRAGLDLMSMPFAQQVLR